LEKDNRAIRSGLFFWTGQLPGQASSWPIGLEKQSSQREKHQRKNEKSSLTRLCCGSEFSLFPLEAAG